MCSFCTLCISSVLLFKSNYCFTLGSTAFFFFCPLFEQAQVYPPKKMCRYNTFNHHFFEPQAEARFKSFLREAGAGLVLVTDPPFGGMVEPLVATFTKIEETWKAEVKPGENKVTVTGFCGCFKHMKGSKERLFIRTKIQAANFRGNPLCQATKKQ